MHIYTLLIKNKYNYVLVSKKWVKAQKENMTLKEKEMSPMEYDNHQLHIDEHIKSVINEENESVVARISNHIKAHQMYLVMINQNNLLTEDNNARN